MSARLRSWNRAKIGAGGVSRQIASEWILSCAV
jgi:hypothetical protein